MADPSYIVDGVLTDGEAWVGISTATSSGSTALFTFTSTNDGQVGDFSQYMDLVLIMYVNGASSGTYSKLNFNNDTGSNYPYQNLYGDGANATAGAGTLGYFDGAWYGGSGGEFGAGGVHLFDINSGKYKSGTTQVASDQDGSGYVNLNGATWKSQAPITEIDITDSSAANFASGSLVSLFGILPRMVS